MNKIILVRCGEIMLKGLNRSYFENKLISNIRKALKSFGKIRIKKSQSRIYIKPQDEDFNINKAIERLSKVFGIVSVSPVLCVKSDFEEIKVQALNLVKEFIEKSQINSKDKSIDKGGGITFKVEARRGNKNFHMDSPQINKELGAYLLSELPFLKVDLFNPSFVISVEVRDLTYITTEYVYSLCGLPVGSNGKAMLMLSGGIDSPVAGWMMAKRGLEIDAVHFYSYPYTSERSKEKVIDLAKILSLYCYDINLYIVPFTEIQLEIAEKCPHDQMTIIMRRIMMIIAEKLAQSSGSLALISGESLGQVASQTLQSLAVTNSSVSMPVFRPLIGMDKNEVIEIARKIGTYDTSILPYEDCCTVFVAKHPETKPKLERIIQSESQLDIEKLVENAINNVEIIKILT